MNIICLDIDDCIFPSNVNYFGRTEDALEVFKINLKRLKMIIEKYNFKLFMTSSWYSLYDLKEGSLVLKDRREIDIDKEVNAAHSLIMHYIRDDFIGLSEGDRKQDIVSLLQMENIEKMIVLDDWDLSEECNLSKRSHFIPMFGFVDGNVGFIIDKFMKTGQKVLRRSYY